MTIRNRSCFLAILIVAAAVAGLSFWCWRAMEQPFYQPGMVREAITLRAPLEPPAEQPGGQRWQVETDIALHHWSVGDGPPVIVLHGGPGYPFDSTPEGFTLLADRYQFHFYDQRGCGKSSRPFNRFERGNFYSNMVELERTLGLGAQIADMERIRRILKHEQWIVIGHSFGAFLASMYAAEFPERVQALVLVSPSGVLTLPNEEMDFFSEVRRRLPEGEVRDYDRFIEDYLDFGNVFEKSEDDLISMNSKIGEYFLMASNSSDLVPPKNSERTNGGWMVQAMYFSMGKRHDYRPALNRIRAPTLVLHATGDILPEAISRSYADGIPGARLSVLRSETDTAGHFPFADNPRQFSQIVGDFLATVPRQDSAEDIEDKKAIATSK